MAKKKAYHLSPAAYSIPEPERKSNVENLKSETPLARKKAQVESHATIRDPGTAKKVTSQRQVFKVTQGTKKKVPPKKVKAKKKTLSPYVISDDILPEEAARKRRVEERKKRQEKRRRQAEMRRSKFGTRLFASIGMAGAIIVGVLCLLLFYLLPKHDTMETQNYSYRFGTGDRDYVSWKVARDGQTLMMNMTDLASFCKFATTGNGHSLRYTIKSSGEYLEFYFDSPHVSINGVDTIMPASARISSGKLYVPLEFAASTISLISVEFDEQRNRIETTLSNDGPIDFSYTSQNVTDAIDFGSLDGTLQNEIIEAALRAFEKQEELERSEQEIIGGGGTLVVP